MRANTGVPHRMTTLDLPPPFDLTVLPGRADAFAHACAVAAARGAGHLVWAERADVIDCAVVLEPAETLAVARQVMLAGLIAAADALAVESPPEKPLAFAWPDALLFDQGLVGGVRLGWPEGCGEAEAPEWLVLGLTLRLYGEAGEGAPAAALAEEGFPDLEAGLFVESWARHLMVALDEWSARGPEAVRARWAQRWDGVGGTEAAALLAAPSWRDAATGRVRA